MFQIIAAAFLVLATAPMSSAAETADDVLLSMAHAYESLQSYKDSGVVLTHLTQDEGPNETTFETAFARPNFFRFAWTSHHPYPPLRHIEAHSVIWSDGTAAFSKYGFSKDPNEITKRASLALTITEATGVSGGAARTVPRLLMPEVGGSSLGEFRGGTLSGVETVEGTNCFHIAGTSTRAGAVDIWVGVDDHLLRKLHTHPAGFLQEEIHRQIRVNESIPRETFAP